MGQYLARQDFAGAADAIVAKWYKTVLERAYADFVISPPIERRVFQSSDGCCRAATTPVPELVDPHTQIDRIAAFSTALRCLLTTSAA
ncbi:nitrogenase-stabilizing/protective protein NifW [Bradyrhizobium sp. DOA9]|uniref:nitrogenase-stabilizing/protective protein NifW n=1 Tax=Bradyrhizobium sp. DOA9 TaxID=1126627 RepID=UPI000499955F|nr:nitrogenase-stabilizing/protective protein NifW [Bradyrhizobium sp. DOA9]GAJ37840.1 nitrogenase stabilizing/protective protein nifW [Bradyrhizobium sp. DOA9]